VVQCPRSLPRAVLRGGATLRGMRLLGEAVLLEGAREFDWDCPCGRLMDECRALMAHGLIEVRTVEWFRDDDGADVFNNGST